ncbi:MAG: hypothetical protein R3A80_13295 [Bdellovibrionota bacterium]
MKHITPKSLFLLIMLGASAHADISGYQRFLSQKAIENLKSIEASQMVYNVYENFIVPRICQNSERTKEGHKKKACKLLGHVREDSFLPVSGDTSQILYRTRAKHTQSIDQETLKRVPAAPKNYEVTYVGCYKRSKNRQDGAECSLFFMILESSTKENLPPILAVKGTSHSEDWKNNLLAGAPILKELTSVLFIELFKELKSSVIGDRSLQIPLEIKGISNDLGGFFGELSAKSHRLLFTGHSLGGALAQELAREVFITTRDDISDLSSGPTINVITWNSLSYTSMIGRLKKGLKNKLDPIFKAGWREEDALKLENYKKLFDGINLSAVNFHTADDVLTLWVNNSLIGKLLRFKDNRKDTQAGDDVLLATQRFISVDSLSGQVQGHRTSSLLKDALYSFGASKKGKTIQILNPVKQYEELKLLAQKEEDASSYVSSPQYFMNNNIRPEFYDKDGGVNFDFHIAAGKARSHTKRSDLYTQMAQSFSENIRHYGRLLGDEENDITLEIYQ